MKWITWKLRPPPLPPGAGEENEDECSRSVDPDPHGSAFIFPSKIRKIEANDLKDSLTPSRAELFVVAQALTSWLNSFDFKFLAPWASPKKVSFGRLENSNTGSTSSSVSIELSVEWGPGEGGGVSATGPEHWHQHPEDHSEWWFQFRIEAQS